MKFDGKPMEFQHHTIGVFTKFTRFILSVQLDLK